MYVRSWFMFILFTQAKTDILFNFMWVNLLIQMLQRSKILILSMKIWKKWSKKHPQNTLKSTAPIWVFGVPITLHSYLWSKYMRAVFCYVPRAVDYSHTDFAQYYYIDYVELVLHWVWCFCSVLLLLADLTRTLSTIVTHFSNCSLYVLCSWLFFVAS